MTVYNNIVVQNTALNSSDNLHCDTLQTIATAHTLGRNVNGTKNQRHNSTQQTQPS